MGAFVSVGGGGTQWMVFAGLNKYLLVSFESLSE
jgi:hypothetical protein